MLQVGSPILNFLLLALEIPLDLSRNASHKGGKFSGILLEKKVQFSQYKTDDIVVFNLNIMFLLVEIYLILEK